MADEADPAGGKGEGAGAAGGDAKPAVQFKSDGEYLASVEKRSRPMITKAVEAARSEIFAALGVESADELAGLKEALESSKAKVSEAEKLKAAHDKGQRELEKERKRSEGLSGRLIKIAKRDALLPYVGQVVDPEVFTMLLEDKLEVDEEGAVSVKDGKALENVVEDLLKKRDYLRKPAAKDGAGTAATEPRKTADGKADATSTKTDDKATTDTAGANGQKPKSFGQTIVDQLKARNQLPRVEGP